METREPGGSRLVVRAMDIRFGEYEVDPVALELRRGGGRVELSPMAVRVLLYLATRSDRLVTRDELYQALWPDGGVDRERLVNTYVRQIRSALGERAGENRYVRTYPRRGYRFVAPLVSDVEAPLPAARRRRRAWIPAVVIVGLVVWAWPGSLPGPFGGDQTPDALERQLGEELLASPSAAQRATAAEYFRKAIADEPDDAGALSGLAVSLFWAGDAVGAERVARRALSVSNREGRAHLALGASLLRSQWAWNEAEEHLRQAVRRRPEDTDALGALAFLLVSAGRPEEARDILERAERLDPILASVTGDLGMMYGWIGDHEAALRLCRRTVTIEPGATWGHQCALEAARALGLEEEVRLRSEALIGLMGGDAEVVFAEAVGVEDQVHALWSYALQSGPRSEFRRAVVLAELGDLEAAVAALERAVREKEAGVPALAAVPALRSLAGDPRYDALVRRVRGTRSGV